MFEKVALRLSLPSNSWSTLLQRVLKDKTQDAHIALAVDQFADYEMVKDEEFMNL